MSYYDRLLKTSPGASRSIVGRTVTSRRSGAGADLSLSVGAPDDTDMRDRVRDAKGKDSSGITAEQGALGLLVLLGIISALRK